MLPDLAGIETAAFWSQVGRASDWATEAGVKKSILLLLNMGKAAGGVANSVDPDQMPRFAASALGLRCLLMIVFRNT